MLLPFNQIMSFIKTRPFTSEKQILPYAILICTWYALLLLIRYWQGDVWRALLAFLPVL